MCCPVGSSFFYALPVLTRGGIINPTLKTACRDRARFRRDFRPLKIPTRLHFSIHIGTFFSLFFSLALLCPLSPPSAFIMSSLSLLYFLAQSLYEHKINYTQYSQAHRDRLLICSPRNVGRIPSVIQRFDTRAYNGHCSPLFEENQLASSFCYCGNRTEY